MEGDMRRMDRQTKEGAGMSRVRPILFNGMMVEAILDGRKTATRRLVMPHNRKKAKELGCQQGNGLWIDPSVDNGDKEGHIKDYSVSPCWSSYSWYIDKYAPCRRGDILYVRETWAFMPCIECMEGYDGKCLCNNIPTKYEDEYSVSEGCFMYKADFQEKEKGCIVWHPSIHMPKQAARIWLRVTDVRAERLHSMTLDDFLAEGVTVRSEAFNDPENAFMQAQGAFRRIWDATLGKGSHDAYGWAADPWVWAVGFERCEKPGSGENERIQRF